MSKLPEVIARLEAATKGSRALDATIWNLINGGLLPIEGFWAATSVESVPHYTTSIDAALTLVRNGPSIYLDWNYCRSRTTALALCIAALKAQEDGKP